MYESFNDIITLWSHAATQLHHLRGRVWRGLYPRATGRAFDVPCCDVWHLEDGKVKVFHCYNNLVATLRS